MYNKLYNLCAYVYNIFIHTNSHVVKKCCSALNTLFYRPQNIETHVCFLEH